MAKLDSRILITGGTGFFGRSLLQRLALPVGDDLSITILSRRPEQFRKRHPDLASLADWTTGDILDPSSLPRGAQFTHIIHGAADSTIGRSLKPSERYEQIVSGTRNVLDLARDVGASRFLFISSGGVYGQQPKDQEKIREEGVGMLDPSRTENTYSIAKRAAEELCWIYREAYGIQMVVARCFAFVGPDLPLDAHFAIGNFIRDALWREKITVAGDGNDVRSYLDQRDLAMWLFSMLEIGADGHAYNVGSDQPISILNLANLVRDLISPSKSVEICGAKGVGLLRSRYVPDISKARHELALDVTISLEDAILNMADAHRQKDSI